MPDSRPRRSLLDDPSGRPGVGVRPTWEPWAFALLAVFAIVFGAIVLQRSAFAQPKGDPDHIPRRKTDAGVFFRAGWAVRESVNPYSVTDENDWYFLYPPGVATLFTPLAEPPASAPLPAPKLWYVRSWREFGQLKDHHTRGYLPYEVSLAIWYAISVLCIWLSVNTLAKALQLGSHDPYVRALSPRYGAWWNVRFWPPLMVLPDFCSSLSKGQVNTLMVGVICLGILLYVQHRRVSAGFAWAFAAFLKVFPGVLVVYPLLRREGHVFLGYVLCFIATMILLPLIFYGPDKTLEYTWYFVERVLLAGLQVTDQASLQAGSNFDNTDNHAIQGALHNLINIRTPRGDRPLAPEPWVRAAHLAVFFLMLLTTVLVGRRRNHEATRDDTALETTLRIGMLCSIMLAAVPMCHRHYFVFLFPSVCALVWINISRSPIGFLNGSALILVPLYPILMSLPRFSQEGLLRDLPIPALTNLIVFVMCAVTVHRLAQCSGRVSNMVSLDA
jgi:hypothetical protein